MRKIVIEMIKTALPLSVFLAILCEFNFDNLDSWRDFRWHVCVKFAAKNRWRGTT